MKLAFIPIFISFLFFSPLAHIIAAAESIPVYGQAPEFELTDQAGRAFRSESLKGKVWVANFIFTRCQGMCPLMSGKMSILAEQLGAEGVHFVSFSVDPDYDTPKALSDYAKRHGAENKNWIFLTGEKSVIWELVSGGFMLGVGEASAEDLAQGAEPVMHSSRFVLVDREGRIRGFFDSFDSGKMEELVKAVNTL